jgi:RNA polymerase sigma-70 factor (ECF subfamily)
MSQLFEAVRPSAGTPHHREGTGLALSEIDRNLLQRCLGRKPRAWEDFVDRFMGLVVHVVRHTAQARNVRLSPEDRDDLCADVFFKVIDDDFALLRSFRGEASLATYLTVVARRIVVKSLLRRTVNTRLDQQPPPPPANSVADPHASAEQQVADREQVGRLLDELKDSEARVVRMFHLEGKSYQEISEATGVPENSIGPILSRARDKMRQAGVN